MKKHENEAYRLFGRSIAYVFNGVVSSGVSDEDALVLTGLYIDAVLTHAALVQSDVQAMNGCVCKGDVGKS